MVGLLLRLHPVDELFHQLDLERLVEENELRIPNMRGIMMARKKPLNVVEPVDASAKTNSISFEKPAPKGEVKLVDPDNLDELIKLLHTEAKVI